MDLWHREIFLQGVPSLEFVLERDAQRNGAVPKTSGKTVLEQTFPPGKDKGGYPKLKLEDFLTNTSLGSWADEVEEIPDPPSSMSMHEAEAAEPANLPFTGYSFSRISDTTNGTQYTPHHWQSSLGFGGPSELLQSHGEPFADVSTHQTAPSSTLESQKGYTSVVNSRNSSTSHQASNEQEDPEKPNLSSNRDHKEAFKDGVLLRTVKGDPDNERQPAARKPVNNGTSKGESTEPRSRELRRKPALLFPPRRNSYNASGRERPLTMTGSIPQSNRETVATRELNYISRARSVKEPVELERSSFLQPRQREQPSDTRPTPSTPPISADIEEWISKSEIAESDEEHSDARTNVTGDSDEEYEEVSAEAVDAVEANMIVRGLLEKYTTLFQSLDAPTKPGQSPKVQNRSPSCIMTELNLFNKKEKKSDY